MNMKRIFIAPILAVAIVFLFSFRSKSIQPLERASAELPEVEEPKPPKPVEVIAPPPEKVSTPTPPLPTATKKKDPNVRKRSEVEGLVRRLIEEVERHPFPREVLDEEFPQNNSSGDWYERHRNGDGSQTTFSYRNRLVVSKVNFIDDDPAGYHSTYAEYWHPREVYRRIFIEKPGERYAVDFNEQGLPTQIEYLKAGSQNRVIQVVE